MRVKWQTEWRTLAAVIGIFLLCFYLPVGGARFDNAIIEALHLVKWYAQEHVLLCLIPAFFIAGAIAVFLSQSSVMKYLGAEANRVVAYGVASVSGTTLAVCSCTVLPLFAGIYRMGAGLGPATAFLYAGPAINILAIILTARVLGFELGLARAIGAIVFSIVIGLLMQFIYRHEKQPPPPAPVNLGGETSRPGWQTALFFALMILILVSANWGAPQSTGGLWYWIFSHKWLLTGVLGALFGLLLVSYFGISRSRVATTATLVILSVYLLPGQPLVPFIIAVIGLAAITSTDRGESAEWFSQSWGFAKQILPLLFWGVLIAGLLLGRPGGEGLIPSDWVARSVGGNSWQANLFAAVAGAFMYFATLTEVPILEGLINNGMGSGPALALLLAGPALSLPNMLVIRSVLGTGKTVVFVLLVVIMATSSGLIYGAVMGS